MDAGFPFPKLQDELPFVLGHGDIDFRNILQTPTGRYALIDWDHAGVMPAAFDLAELCRNLDVGLAREVIALIARLGSSQPAIPPATQLALGVLNKTAIVRASGNRFVDFLRARHGLTRGQARREQLEVSRKIREFLAAIATDA